MTGQGAVRMVCSATLPNRSRAAPLRAWVPSNEQVGLERARVRAYPVRRTELDGGSYLDAGRPQRVGLLLDLELGRRAQGLDRLAVQDVR